MEENIVITSAKYLTSAVKKDQYPEEKLPEFVFMGRSNVGKSSLINSLTRVGGLSRVSAQPGKTQTINFFNIGIKNRKNEERKNFYLVDLPGYGYAKVGRDKRNIWKKFIEEYLLNSPNIVFVAQLVDVRHEPMSSDVDMFKWLVSQNLPVLVVATKIDKIGKNERNKNIAAIKRAFGVKELPVLPYSSLKNEGRLDLLQTIADSLE